MCLKTNLAESTSSGSAKRASSPCTPQPSAQNCLRQLRCATRRAIGLPSSNDPFPKDNSTVSCMVHLRPTICRTWFDWSAKTKFATNRPQPPTSQSLLSKLLTYAIAAKIATCQSNSL